MKIEKGVTTENMAGNVPVFDIVKMSPTSYQATDTEGKAQEDALSFFDVKEIYDRAYAALEDGRDDFKAKEMMAEAIKMDMRYRCQLSRQSRYKKPSQMNDFKIITTQIS